MAEYEKPWLSIDKQIDRLVEHELEIDDRDHAAALLRAIGYYRLTGYLYPFRPSEEQTDEEGRPRIKVLSGYRSGTTLLHAEEIIDFARQLRMLVMDGVERIEVAVRMQMGMCSVADPHSPTRILTVSPTPLPLRRPTVATPRRVST